MNITLRYRFSYRNLRTFMIIADKTNSVLPVTAAAICITDDIIITGFICSKNLKNMHVYALILYKYAL